MTPLFKGIVSVFVVFQVAALVEWALPDNSPVKTTMAGFFAPYVLCTGTWQMWQTFAPDPSNLNLYIHAAVTHSDGTTSDFALPRMDKLDFARRYEEVRFRMYAENIHVDSNHCFWPALARWIAAQDCRRTGKQPTAVRLIRTWWEVPSEQPQDARLRPVPAWHSFTFYETAVKDGHLVPLEHRQ